MIAGTVGNTPVQKTVNVTGVFSLLVNLNMVFLGNGSVRRLKGC